MKATQAGKHHQGNGESLTQTVFEKQPCHVCGTKSHPWGYIFHGKAHVCSKACYKTYEANREKAR